MEQSQPTFILDHTFLDLPKNSSNFVVLIVLNHKIKKNLYKWIYHIADHVIFADGGCKVIKKLFSDPKEM
jgi:hypothetical protein